MTNTELIRQEIERRIGAMYNFSAGYSALNTCRELLDFIDKLPKDDTQIEVQEIRGEVVKDRRGKLIVRASGIRDDLLLGDKVKIYVFKEGQ